MMWPINKLKNIFISIDTQLRQQRQQLDEERQRIKKQEEQIAALRNEQKSIQRSLEENEKKLLLCTEWMDERFQKTESKLQQCEVREKQIQADRTEKEQWLNDKFYHTDVYYVNTQFRLCDMHLPGNASKYEALQNKHRGQNASSSETVPHFVWKIWKACECIKQLRLLPTAFTRSSKV